MKNVIFLAPPGAGKGTFSEYLIKNFGYKHFSTGSILREKAKEDKKIKEILDSGRLLYDETVLPIVKEVLSQVPKNTPFILDGIPRTLHQAKILDIILNGLGLLDVVVIFIDVEKEVLLDRILGRKVCESCHRTYNSNIEKYKPKKEGICDDCNNPLVVRKDDNKESFEKRYLTYLESTYPIIAYYKEKGCLKVIQNNELDQTESLNQLRSVISGH